MQGKQSHYIYLNTRDRDEGSNASALFYVDKRSMPPAFMMTLESIQFPHHMYPFSVERHTTTVYFQEDASSVTTAAPITLNRNYTGTSLATEVATALTAASPGGYTYSVVYDIDTKRLTITPSAGTFRLVSGEGDINYEIGYNIKTQVDFAASIECADPIDLSGTKYVDVISSLGGSLNFNSTGAYTVLCRIPTQASFGEVVLYEPSFKHSIVGQNTNNTVMLSLRDDRGFYLQLGDNSHVGYAFQVNPMGTLF